MLDFAYSLKIFDFYFVSPQPICVKLWTIVFGDVCQFSCNVCLDSYILWVLIRGVSNSNTYFILRDDSVFNILGVTSEQFVYCSIAC